MCINCDIDNGLNYLNHAEKEEVLDFIYQLIDEKGEQA